MHKKMFSLFFIKRRGVNLGLAFSIDSYQTSTLLQLSVYFQLERAAPSLVWTMIRVTQLAPLARLNAA